MFEFSVPVDPLIPCRGRPGLWVPPAAVAERLAGVVWPAQTAEHTARADSHIKAAGW